VKLSQLDLVKKNDSGEVTPVNLKAGDVVLFGQYAGNEVKLEGEDYLIMSESDIFGVIE
jgi:chaperonin GroES